MDTCTHFEKPFYKQLISDLNSTVSLRESDVIDAV
jgi:hypothetical protein